MTDKLRLNILGCVSDRLNLIMELCQDHKDINTFNILKNIPVELSDDFQPHNDWNINIYNCYKEDTKEQYQKQFNPQLDDIYAISLLGGKSKELVYNYFKNLLGIDKKQFANLIHPTSYVSQSVKLNYGLQLESLCTIAVCTSLGFCVFIKRNCSIGHHCQIEDYVTINPGVTMSSFVKVGKGTIIGSGTSIKNDITIGENSLIGVGSVVVKNIPPNSVAFGNPCKVFRTNDKAQKKG